MKEKRDGKEKLTSGQLIRNCLFAVGELFRNSPVFETLFVSELMIRTALAAFMSTFYVKILVNMLEKGASFGREAAFIIGAAVISAALFVFENILSHYNFYNCMLRVLRGSGVLR